MSLSPLDNLIDAVLAGAPDATVNGLIEAAQSDIAARHARDTRAFVSKDRCTVQIIAVLADGTERRLL
ncbi:hypothetical protein [Falsiruegeria litorea]|uniref:hypothetical protein n=1 Tax=Falsiruegeria litorea TaxID=1280831 RepID=UPI001BFE7C60|nr:hypothetical protein [Falsiruegeria litorea]MBT8169665.1 hypothetical protein [Falsiruegeria litorea]